MDVKDAVFNILAGLAYVDGRFDPREAVALSQTLIELYGEDAVEALNRHMNSIDPKSFDFHKYIDEAVKAINKDLDMEDKKNLIKTLILLSGVDMQVALAEIAYIQEVADKLGVDLKEMAMEEMKS